MQHTGYLVVNFVASGGVLGRPRSFVNKNSLSDWNLRYLPYISAGTSQEEAIKQTKNFGVLIFPVPEVPLDTS
jgi:hypothetical protein